MNEYEKQASDFLNKYGIKFSYVNRGKSFKWGLERFGYFVTFTRTDKNGKEKTMSFNFWGSNADYTKGIKDISSYDVLSCLSGEDQYKTVNDIISSFGSDLTGIDVDGLLQEARDMRQFFTPAMLRDLCEIN